MRYAIRHSDGDILGLQIRIVPIRNEHAHIVGPLLYPDFSCTRPWICIRTEIS